MRRRIVPFILAGALSIAAVAPAAAAPRDTNQAVQNALVGLVVQAVARDVVEVSISDSLNNLLQNALQNADVLNDLEVRIFDILNNLNVNVSDIDIELLENGNIQVTVLGGAVSTPIIFS